MEAYSIPSPLKAVIFDLFGTLVDEASDREAVEGAMRAVRDRFGLEEAATDLAGEYAVILMDRIAEERDDPGESPIGPYELAARDALEELLAARGRSASGADSDWFWKLLLRETRASVRAFPDALPCLENVAKSVPHVGVLTDADPVLSALALEGIRAAPLVSAVTTAEEAGAFKPDLAPFEVALAKAGARPRDVLLVGDSYERDVEPALALGIQAVLLDRHGARTIRPPRKIRSLDELPALLRPG